MRLAVAVLAGCVAGSASADTLKDGPHLGWVQGGDVRNEDIAVGWQGTYEFSDYFSLDMTYTRHEDELSREELNYPGFPSDSRLDLEFNVVALTGRASFSPLRRLWLYGGAGVGYYFINEEAEGVRESLAATPVPGPGGGTVTEFNINIDKDFGFHLALGFELLLSDKWEIFAEYRWVDFSTDADVTAVETVPAEDIGKSKLTYNANETFDYDYGLARFGINYRF